MSGWAILAPSAAGLQWGRGSEAAVIVGTEVSAGGAMKYLRWGRGSEAAVILERGEGGLRPRRPSMGPRLRGRGHWERGTDLPEDKRLQWGRGSEAAVMTSRRHPRSMARSFNGAAAQRPRSF